MLQHQPNAYLGQTIPANMNFAQFSQQAILLTSMKNTPQQMNFGQTPDQVRPPTPTRQRISASELDSQMLLAELANLRARNKELESENLKLKTKLNSSSVEFNQLQMELERLKANEVQVRVQNEQLEKQRKSLEASADIKIAYKTLRQQVLQIAESLRVNSPNWFVSFFHAAQQPKRSDLNR